MTRVDQPEVLDMQRVVGIVVALASLKPFAMGDLTDVETKAIDWLANVYMIGRDKPGPVPIGRGGKHNA